MPDQETSRLFTTRRVPLRYLVIPKCGCTFVKNLLWRLEHGHNHGIPIRVHDDDGQFLRADALGLSAADIRAERHAFTVLRNPVDRFFSLYTDKVIGPGWQRYVPLRKVLTEGYGLDPDANSAEAHRANCEIMIDWLERNLADEVDLPKEAHWTPQSYRWRLMEKFDLKLLMLNDIEEQLTLLAGDLVPGLAQTLAGLEPNRSRRPVPKGAVLVPELRKRINAVYAADRRLFNAVRDAWDMLNMNTASPDDIPRALSL
jgi:hypothetical protein